MLLLLYLKLNKSIYLPEDQHLDIKLVFKNVLILNILLYLFKIY